MRILIGLLVALAVVVVATGLFSYNQVAGLDVDHVAGDVHVISGLGGNVAVLTTTEGAVVVDSMTFALQGEKIRARAEELGAGPVRALISTHYHSDHTHGNPAFDEDTRFVATQRTLEHLRFFDRVLHTGDLVFNRLYPNIDLEGGGSLAEWSASLDRVLALDFDRVIPGHGAVTDAEGIRGFQRFTEELWSVGQQAARDGIGLDEMIESARTTSDEGFENAGVPILFELDRPFVLRRAWQEASGAVKPANPPAP